MEEQRKLCHSKRESQEDEGTHRAFAAVRVSCVAATRLDPLASSSIGAACGARSQGGCAGAADGRASGGGSSGLRLFVVGC